MNKLGKFIGVSVYLTQDCEKEKDFYFSSEREVSEFMTLCSSRGLDFSPITVDYNTPAEAFMILKNDLRNA